MASVLFFRQRKASDSTEWFPEKDTENSEEKN